MLDWLDFTKTDATATRPLFIAGAWVPAASGATFEDLEPASGAVIARVASAGPADIEAAIAAATAAQPAWAALTPAARASFFHRAADLFVERQQEFAQMLIAETGSGFGKAMFECSLVPLALREAAGLPTREIGAIYPSQVPGKRNITLRSPRGVIGAISPWNFPLYLSLRGFVYALALGNTIVLKPSEDSPISGGLMLAKLFAEAGFPAGTLNVLTTDRDSAALVGKAFVEDKRIAGLSFTGSTGVGRLLATECASKFKPIMLELGGKNPMIVLDDADLDRAVDLAFFGSFLHQGQICMSTDRVLVARPIYESFLARLLAKTAHFAPTAPQEPTCVVGPIINRRQFDRIAGLLDDARAKGAKIRCGGTGAPPYYEPTVVTDVTPEMRIWHEEVFGPVVMVRPYDSEDEAVAMANDSDYGLSAAIVTSDIHRGAKLAERITAGMIHVNDSTVHDETHCPFSGVGASGGGGKWGPQGAIEAFTTQRWISIQDVPHQLPF